ncbi:SGNH/GDSL hydrolase family protein [Flectobacillus roseus]|uniref:GDSL-type esterase/lipase family protein n=2 Tax=Flectobacillus roseus TaxID=502259 RepID=A0ABT6Y717_9BACT|nr:SGNH/GDSL hydrolase family protein [Flectobacillus roseus]MDI9859364.1 GDSL-type esterase/lipase family protein [Flectobacillus roseus]
MAGKKIKVAYLGGSITRADKGWRDQTFEWLKTEYPNTPFEQIMAAIGGTGSDFGAYRLKNHVLQYKPDLVFVEFAVNDHSKTSQQVKESIEGIVRQIWKANPKTDICFVHTFQKVQLPFYFKGKFPVSATAIETVADYYQIPSICMALPVTKMLEDGKILMQGKIKDYPDKMVFSEDGVHPFVETGHKIYAETVKKHFKLLQSVGKLGKHTLKPALMPNNLQKVTMVLMAKIEKSKGWQRVDSVVLNKPFASLMPPVYASEDTTDFIKITFRGKRLGIVDVIGPSSGQMVVWIDNAPPQYINRFDDYCTYYRMNYSLISGLSEGKHTAIIKVSPQKLDKATILSKRNNIINNPQLFAKQALYIGAILTEK